MRRIIFNAELVGPWVREKSGGIYRPGDQAIGIVDDLKLICGVTYDGYTGASISIHSRCDVPSATSRRFYWMIFDYPFNQLRVKRVTGIVSTANVHAQEINERLGFRREAVLKDYFSDGDAIIYVMFGADCRWLALGERYTRKAA